ncbi:caspase family protein [Spirosoma koreense]
MNPPSTSRPKLYALVVGIDAYRADLIVDDVARFPALHGCKADADKMKAYLEKQTGFEQHIERLSDQQATKTEIVRLFREHLGQAGPNDVALFYFSGHGTQEQADPVWSDETDGGLECIACYYDESNVQAFRLADKELRYLIHDVWQTRKPHIVTIFDCCHSGDNTRALEVAQTAYPGQEAVIKRIPILFGKRDWSSFVFGSVVSQADIREQGTGVALPEGVHVHLAACESDQSAVEVAGEGVFTKALIQILNQSAGGITYYDLQGKIRAYLRNVYEQQPRFRVAGGSADLLYRTFLNQSAQQASLMGIITHNSSGWALNKGAIQGIGKTHDQLIGIDPNTEGHSVQFRVDQVFADYATLRPVGENKPDESVDYQVAIAGLMVQAIRVGFQLEDTRREDRATLLNRLMTSLPDQLIIVEEADGRTPEATRNPETTDNKSAGLSADYVVRGRKGAYYLTYPVRVTDPDDGAAYRPLTMPIDASTTTALDRLIADLKHLARWEYIRQLTNQNPPNGLAGNPLEVAIRRVRPDGTEERVPLNESVVRLTAEQIEGEWQCPLRIEVTNRAAVDLYVSAVYLTVNFQAYLSLLPDEVYRLEAGKTVSFQHEGQPIIPFGLSETITLYNWPERVEFIKFIASTDVFDPLAMQLDALPDPPTLTEQTDKEAERGIGLISTKKVPVKGWTTQIVELHWQNPLYNQVDADTLRAMLTNEALTDFALGLYFENVPGADFPNIQPRAVLQQLTANVPLQEKGLLGDIGLDLANTIARARRNQRYRRTLREFPNRLKIVSEGDSWFQHPLVTDIIDHLSAYYAIYCVAAAGDTLRNMTMAKTNVSPPLEEYIQAINEQQPDLFVLSGGGNDILGEQFRRYIRTGVPTGSPPEAYLDTLLASDLDSLQAMYRTLFQTLQKSHPDMPVLVHGYDYIIPLSVTNKGWLGRYMIEKGIDQPAVRKAILHYILDEFNHRVKTVAAEFPAIVSYIPTPGTVPDDEWYDEIHPNAEGFGRVADKFKKRIDELKPTKKAVSIPSKVHLDTTREFIVNPAATKYIINPDRDYETGFPFRRKSNLWDDSYFGSPSSSAPLPGNDTLESLPMAQPIAVPSPTPTRAGQLDYDIPGVMQVGKLSACVVRIGDSQVAQELLKISDSSVREVIRVGDEMSVRLIDGSGDDCFTITAFNNERQAIFPGEPTEWNFKVKPLKSGQYPLLLRVTIHMEDRSKDLDILTKEIQINTDSSDPVADKSAKRILFLAANPNDTQQLRLGAESEQIKAELQMSTQRDMILFTTNMAVTPQNMTRYILKEKPTIVHFSGHANADGLCLETTDGAPKLIGATALEALFSAFADTVQCVVLNACYSKEQADAIVKSVPYVIGMTRAVKDRASLAFSSGFYQALGEGESIVTAYKIGRAQMALEAEGQGEIPVLLQKNSP